MTHGDVRIECKRGDIAAQPDVRAVVCAANAWLTTGAGVAGALHRAAGPGLAEECRALAPIAPGEAVLTGGHDLPNDFVVHTLGPVYGVDVPSDALLAACYRSSLALADGHRLESVAFPAISTGVFGYPVRAAAEVAIRTVLELAPALEHVRLVRFVLFGAEDLAVHEAVLAEQLSNPGVET